MTWKKRSSPAISLSMKLRSWSNPAAVGVQRVMEVRNLPRLFCVLERVLNPDQLSRVKIVAVEHKKAHVVSGVRVVALPAHVERCVSIVAGLVVVAQARVELHPGVEQGPIRALELLDEIGRLLAAVHVVAQHDDHVECEDAMPQVHLTGDIVLGLLAGPIVADRSELQRDWSVGDRELLSPES